MTTYEAMAHPDGRWHVPAAVLAAYAAEAAAEADAWSAEAHLARCGRCRADLAALVSAGPLVGTITSARAVVVAEAAGQPERSGRTAGPAVTVSAGAAGARGRTTAPGGEESTRTRAMARFGRSSLVLRGPWLTAVVIAVIVAGLAEILTAAAPLELRHVPVILLLAPLVPLAGVGLCYRATDRGWAEAVLATPSAGLRLVLWRVLAVLVIAVPVTVSVALFTQEAGPVVWLLPALGLASASLALGSVIELGRATGVMAGVWVAVVAGPSVLLGHLPLPVFTSPAQGVWAIVTAAAIAVVIVRRASFGRLPSWRPVVIGEER